MEFNIKVQLQAKEAIGLTEEGWELDSINIRSRSPGKQSPWASGQERRRQSWLGSSSQVDTALPFSRLEGPPPWVADRRSAWADGPRPKGQHPSIHPFLHGHSCLLGRRHPLPADLCRTALPPGVSPLCPGSGAAADPDGQEVWGAESQEEVWLQEVLHRSLRRVSNLPGGGEGGGHLGFLWSSLGLPPTPRSTPPSHAPRKGGCEREAEPPERDSTVAVIVGATVGGFLAVVILALVVVKCIRRKKQQRLNTDDQKTEEEGKTDGEGNPEEGTK
ncbi:hypothetical protein JD844_031661 [Phrynosoma platyrhinos]|uniref:receptor protein-tyrosine kinase n=1 Tax=Phrynosoma platyrhinos TaxID=52577 RepID=A0ABQ7T165_PHRPL|nr:hypothetical protein JD844_031661 [Phrynosoma platyrhinos]